MNQVIEYQNDFAMKGAKKKWILFAYMDAQDISRLVKAVFL